jgi:uncharacterized protein YlxW (UPF0749 family)
MRRGVAQFSLFLVALLIGMLLVGQLRSQARPVELSSLSAQELSARIETLSTLATDLRGGLADLREQVRDYELAEELGRSALDVTREDLRRIRAFGGLAPVEGQGIVMRVDGGLDAIAVNDLIQELRNAGAEAIAIDDVRITAGSVALRGTSSLEIDGAPIGRTFTMSAIGSPEGLLSALERPGGIISQLELFVSATIEVDQRDHITLPATTLDMMPEAARATE